MLWIAVVVGVLAAILSLLMVSYGPRLGYTLREPDDAQAERLQRLREGDGPDVAIRITSGEGSPGSDLVGLPGRRQLVVTDAALEQLDDDALRALLAVEDERARAGIELMQAVTTGIAIGIFATAYVSEVGFLPVMVGAWGIVLLGIAIGRRRHYSADAAVADELGRETLRNALERVAEIRGDSLDPGRFWRAVFEIEPSVGARLERLER